LETIELEYNLDKILRIKMLSQLLNLETNARIDEAIDYYMQVAMKSLDVTNFVT